MSENERVREVRKTLGMTQQAFGDALGVKPNAISMIESGVNALSEQVRRGIMREYGVREEWLRDGTGAMFVEKSRDEEIDAFFHAISFEGSGFKRQFVSMLARLSEDEWAMLERKARELAEGMEKADL